MLRDLARILPPLLHRIELPAITAYHISLMQARKSGRGKTYIALEAIWKVRPHKLLEAGGSPYQQRTIPNQGSSLIPEGLKTVSFFCSWSG